MGEKQKGRKIGRNKKSPSMKGYPYRVDRNAKRRRVRHEKRMAADAERIAKRIASGKPVHKRHIKSKGAA